MNKGRRLTTILLTFLFAIGMFTVASFADSYDFEVVGTGGNPIGTVTLTASDVTYDGQQHMITVRNTIANSDLTNWDSTIRIGDYGNWTTSRNTNHGKYAIAPTKYKKSGSTEESETAPTDAGSYSATVTVYYLDEDFRTPQAGTTEYKYRWVSRGSGSIVFKINKKIVDVDWANTELVYSDGVVQKPTATYADVDGTAHGLDVAVTAGDGKSVGQHTAQASFKENDPYKVNYALNESTTTTNYRIVSKTVVDVVWSDTTATYNGQDQFPTAQLRGVNQGDDVSVAIRKDAAGTEYASGKHKNADIYKDYAYLTGADADKYVLATDSWTKFTINPKPVSVSWVGSDGAAFDTELTYDGQNHLPKPEVTGAVSGETISAVAANKSGTAYPDNDTTHINHGKYTVYAKITASGETLASNYVIPDSSFTYTIDKLVAQLDWYRPVYDDKTGEEVKSDGVVQLQKVKEDVTIGLVYNAKEQKPVVKISNLVTRADTGKEDKVTIVVEIREGKTAREAGTYYVSAKIVSGSGAPNYTLEDAGNVERDMEILKRPVVLDWGYKETVDAEPQYKGNVHIDSDGYDYKTIYNGKLQEPVVRITNLPLDDYEDEDYNTVKNIVLDQKRQCEWPDSVAPTRDYTDAGIYDLHAGTLYDRKNYSYYILEQNNGDDASGSIVLSGTKADKYDANYTIEQLKAKLKWTPKPAEFKYYDGHEHHSECAIANVQQNEKGVDDVYKFTYKIEKWNKETEDFEESETSIDAGLYLITATEVDNKNYTLVEEKPKVPVAHFLEEYVIFPRPVELKWDNSEFTYDANKKTVTAKINNIVTADHRNGPDDVDVVYSDGVIEGKRYAHIEANAGSYTAIVPELKGEQVDNYSLFAKPEEEKSSYVDGYTHDWKINKKDLTVTVYDKTGYYGDDPATYVHGVKYTGLVNGDANKDDNNGVPGTYDANQFKDPEKPNVKAVVEGALAYSCKYKQYGKPGKYAVSASGLTSDNYNIKFVDGTLTIKDRNLAGDLVAKAKAGNKKGTISWKKVKGAAKYQIYFSPCNKGNKKYTPKLYKTVSSSKKTYTVKKLKKNTYYKFYVVALDKSGKRLAKTEEHHFCTNNVSEIYTNPKSVTASKTKVTVKKGGTYKVKTTVTKVRSDKRLTNGTHTKKVRYRSAAKPVATVSKNGTIKGVETGWCRVYTMGANGIWQVIEVTVK